MPTPGLEQLRDIHLPPGLAMWQQLAESWPLIALTFSGIAWWLFRQTRARSAASGRGQALARLHCAEERYARDGNAVRFARDLDAVLRQEAARRYPERNVRRMAGDDWLNFLDETGGMDAFRSGAGRCLISLPYQRLGQLESADVVKLVARWLAH